MMATATVPTLSGKDGRRVTLFRVGSYPAIGYLRAAIEKRVRCELDAECGLNGTTRDDDTVGWQPGHVTLKRLPICTAA
jgi:hypothetical protein